MRPCPIDFPPVAERSEEQLRVELIEIRRRYGFAAPVHVELRAEEINRELANRNAERQTADHHRLLIEQLRHSEDPDLATLTEAQRQAVARLISGSGV